MVGGNGGGGEVDERKRRGEAERRAIRTGQTQSLHREKDFQDQLAAEDAD